MNDEEISRARALNLAQHAREASILAGNEVCRRIMVDCSATICELLSSLPDVDQSADERKKDAPNTQIELLRLLFGRTHFSSNVARLAAHQCLDELEVIAADATRHRRLLSALTEDERKALNEQIDAALDEDEP